jgi:hypothetical protein
MVWEEPLLLASEVAPGDRARMSLPRVDVEGRDRAAAVVVDDDELAAVGGDRGIAGPALRTGAEARSELLRRRGRP